MPDVVFHNAVRHVRGVWPARLLPTAFVFASLDRMSSTLPWHWAEILMVLMAGLTVVMLAEPFWAARFRTLTVTDDAVTLRRGWLAPQVRTAALDQITSVQVDEPMSQRLAGVRAVTLVTSGATNSALSMPALTPEAAEQLVAMVTAAQHRMGAQVGAGVGAAATVRPQDLSIPASPATAVLYRAGVRDIVATAASGGYLLVVAAAVVGTARDLGDLTGVFWRFSSWHDARTWAVGALVLAVGVPLLLAARFWGFRIEQGAGGECTISYGAVERTRHTVGPGQVVAVTLVRTPVDLLLRTSRLELSTALLSESERRSVVFPSMSHEDLARIVRQVVGRDLPTLRAGSRSWWWVGPLVVAGIAAGVLALPLGSGLLRGVAAVVAAVATVAMVRYVSGRVSVCVGSGDVTWSDVGLAYRATVYRRGSLMVVLGRRFPFVPIGNLTVVGWAHHKVSHRRPVRGDDLHRTLSAVVRGDPSTPFSAAPEVP